MGTGTTFGVFLPASEKPALVENESSDTPGSGRGRVLVMDDEESVRNVAGRMLMRLGYEVSVSRDGSEAIDLYRQAKEKGEPFDAVIMDLTIPGGLGGKEAVLHLKDLDPQIRAIVSSGYCIDPIMGDFKSYGFSGDRYQTHARFARKRLSL